MTCFDDPFHIWHGVPANSTRNDEDGWPKEMHRLAQSDIEHYNSLPPAERLKCWESYTRLVEAGELEPFEGLIQKPEEVTQE